MIYCRINVDNSLLSCTIWKVLLTSVKSAHHRDKKLAEPGFRHPYQTALTQKTGLYKHIIPRLPGFRAKRVSGKKQAIQEFSGSCMAFLFYHIRRKSNHDMHEVNINSHHAEQISNPDTHEVKSNHNTHESKNLITTRNEVESNHIIHGTDINSQRRWSGNPVTTHVRLKSAHYSHKTESASVPKPYRSFLQKYTAPSRFAFLLAGV